MRKRIAALALLLCASGAQARDPDALPRAIRAGDGEAVQAALAGHADANAKLAFGATPLGWAVQAQDAGIVAALLAHGAKPNVADAERVTPLALACELGNGAIVAHLLAAHADVRKAAPDGVTPLAICARYGPADAVARMLAGGAAADSVDSRGQTPLMWAAASGRTEAIALLVKAGADVNRVSKAGFTPLFFAIKSNVPAATEALLSAGAKADYRGPENTSAAQLAAYQKNYPAALLLVSRGADLTERDREGRQLLHVAAEAGDTALVAALLAKGADANALTGASKITWVTEANFGRPPPVVPPLSPLLVAAEKGQTAAMKLLLAAGANPHFVAANGENVVLAAAQGHSPEALELALTLAPDVNVATPDGVTALHMLVGGGMYPELPAMLHVLAAHGARTDLKEKHGFTAAKLADGGLGEVKAIFLETFPQKAGVSLAGAQGKPVRIATR
ncbi:ankyrin repeat domain-containing protein [Sphingomonas immobilis]|uniref:Ankyrin repeat domain-containing protein n=1 Tax=Sphingomonas immobilis TaxID=3063997 RepID=A0ABT8ZT43_9SPHN|nr:ankyrin repeat domain-containing protein [Sphingomonas sp. CA1-15]MDO7840733.1 ankyrin repeat domain-containing protein [Sphingomonas sp. CA1-15]